MGHHKFDVKKKSKLDNELRRKMLPPFETLVKLDLNKGDVMADIGCGIGYFAIPAAEIVGPSGKVYAMDISLEMLEEVERKITEQNITNVITVKTLENELKIEDDTATFAFLGNVFHELEDIPQFLKEVKRIVSENGKIVVLDWQKIQSDFGPPMNHRVDKSEVVGAFQEAGLKNINHQDVSEHFYAVTGFIN